MLVKVVAFDAKKFQREARHWNEDETEQEKTTVFVSQLGVGVTVPKPNEFAERYVEVSQDLQKKFALDYTTPFFSSTCLKDNLDINEAAEFAHQLISKMRHYIESVHCSYIALPDANASYVEVGGKRCPRKRMPAVRFIDSLGQSFSYLAALSYLWSRDGVSFDNLEMHIDAFRSKQTNGWNAVKRSAPVKIFYKGDECNPFISCADTIAFLVDDMLSSKRLKLFREPIMQVLEPYKFDVTTQYFNERSQNYYTWRTDHTINTSPYLSRPVVFLAIDQLAVGDRGQEYDIPPSQDTRAANRQRRTDMNLRQTEIYQAALKYAYQRGGCMKLFSANEDKGIVKSGDVLIYAGSNSERIGKILQGMADIQLHSGLEAIKLVKKPNNGAN